MASLRVEKVGFSSAMLYDLALAVTSPDNFCSAPATLLGLAYVGFAKLTLFAFVYDLLRLSWSLLAVIRGNIQRLLLVQELLSILRSVEILNAVSDWRRPSNSPIAVGRNVFILMQTG